MYDTVIDHRLYYALVATLSRMIGLYHGMLLKKSEAYTDNV